MFTIHKTDTGAVVPWEYMPAAAGEYKAGQMLNVSGGYVAAIAEEMVSTPGYLCMSNTVIENYGDLIPVTRVSGDVIYETTVSDSDSNLYVGGKACVLSGGLEVKLNVAGSFELSYVDGLSSGSMVRGRFV